MKSSSTSLYLHVHKEGCIPTKGLRAMPTHSCFAGADCTRPTTLAVQICSGTPLTFEMPIPCQCRCMLALCFYQPHLLIFHPRVFQWPMRLLFLTKALGHCLHL
ncbi:unnamed protein product [Ixodes persulcatus]